MTVPPPSPPRYAADLAPGDRVREPYTSPTRTVERVWFEPEVDALVCVKVDTGRILYLHPARRVRA